MPYSLNRSIKVRFEPIVTPKMNRSRYMVRVIARSAWRNRGWRRNKNPMAMPINSMVNMLIIYAFFIIGYDDNDMGMSYRIKKTGKGNGYCWCAYMCDQIMPLNQ